MGDARRRAPRSGSCPELVVKEADQGIERVPHTVSGRVGGGDAERCSHERPRGSEGQVQRKQADAARRLGDRRAGIGTGAARYEGEALARMLRETKCLRVEVRTMPTTHGVPLLVERTNPCDVRVSRDVLMHANGLQSPSCESMRFLHFRKGQRRWP
jgi:hypothetical protein